MSTLVAFLLSTIKQDQEQKGVGRSTLLKCFRKIPNIVFLTVSACAHVSHQMAIQACIWQLKKISFPIKTNSNLTNLSNLS